MTVTRPETTFDGASHTYYDKNGNKLLGVSSVAKIGEALRAFDIGSKWGWKLGYEGADALLMAESMHGSLPWWDTHELRERLIKEGLAPWSKRDQAADRGNWVHDILEALADGHESADAVARVILEGDVERNGHARALLQWYLDYRPEFVATEVQVTSEKHGFAGRYDIRCKILAGSYKNGRFEPELYPGGRVLCLVDLKTSKHIYPLSHYVQLEGYELASVEMGFPATDVRMVLNTKPDGTYEVGVSYATGQTFLDYLGAYRAIKWMEENDPVEVAKRAVDERLVALLPASSRDLAGEPGCPATSQEVGRAFGRLRKRGLVSQDAGGVWHGV